MGLKKENTDVSEKMTSKQKTYQTQISSDKTNNDNSTDVDMIGSVENLSSDLVPEVTGTPELMTPPQMPVLQHPVHVRNTLDRPQSAHLHRVKVAGRMLRAMGDQYQCNTCGRTLRTLGDEMSTIYAMRRALSSNDLPDISRNIPER